MFEGKRICIIADGSFSIRNSASIEAMFSAVYHFRLKSGVRVL
jgi:hypothetical protein